MYEPVREKSGAEKKAAGNPWGPRPPKRSRGDYSIVTFSIEKPDWKLRKAGMLVKPCTVSRTA
jgi:hypothetical protein